MRKIAPFFFLVLFLMFGGSKINAAKLVTPTPTMTPIPTLAPTPTEVPVKENLTVPTSKESVYRLEAVLEKQIVGGWNVVNSGKKVVRWALSRGVEANTIVLLLLLPLVATLVSGLHYLLGLSGYGIFMPTMIAVTFLATGILGGLMLFALILTISLLSGMGLKKLKIHFWPSRSINLLFISVATFVLMVGSSFVPYGDISKISIFPILFMILLAEEFTRTQLVKSKNEAKSLTVGTLVLAMVGAGIMSIRGVQEWVLLNPEITIGLVVILNLLVGNYTGIRLLEIKRFSKAIRKK